MSLVGKTLGCVTFVGEEMPPEDEPRRFKYGGTWYRIRCECGTEKLIPRAGSAGYRSCGCHQNDHLKTGIEMIKYFPDRVKLGTVREVEYKDL